MGVILSSIFATVHPDIIDSTKHSISYISCKRWFFIKSNPNIPKLINKIDINTNINDTIKNRIIPVEDEEWGFFIEIEDGLD